MTVSNVGGRGPADSRWHAGRLGWVVGPAIAAGLVASAFPAGAVPGVAALPAASVSCDPAVGQCATTPIGGPTANFVVGALGGTRQATLAAVVNETAGPDCPKFDEGDSDTVRVGFTVHQEGATWTKVVGITGATPATQAAATQAARSSLVCFEAPYRFFVQPGFPIGKGPTGKGPFTGVLASCATVDSIFPVEARGRVQALPCVQVRRAVPLGNGFVVQNTVRIPRDTASTRLRQTS